eukprot:UN28083
MNIEERTMKEIEKQTQLGFEKSSISSRNSSRSSPHGVMGMFNMQNPTVGDRIELRERRFGAVKFVGKITGFNGIWYGIDLDLPTGKHDGTVEGKRYFVAKPKHGAMVRRHKIVRVMPEEENTDIKIEENKSLIATILHKNGFVATKNGIDSELGVKCGFTKEQIEKLRTWAQEKANYPPRKRSRTSESLPNNPQQEIKNLTI